MCDKPFLYLLKLSRSTSSALNSVRTGTELDSFPVNSVTIWTAALHRLVKAMMMSEACIKGGVTAIELAFTTPRAPPMPTGGVNVENAGDWINAGCVAVGAGGALTGGGKTADEITATAKKFIAAVQAARK